MTNHLQQLKDRLVHTWQPLLARFGRFTEIQAQAIEPLLDGKNCLLTSATSSGKTEAALAPLLENHLTTRKQRGRLALLYISPTRALARDLYWRLQPAMKKLAIKIQIKTGDEPALNANRLPELLITTPESFDSLLANRPRLAKDIHTVILDEIHLYDNSARGDQVRVLLNRLRRIKQFAHANNEIDCAQLQFCAMSATIDAPQQLAARYFSDPVVISVPGQRRFNVELQPFSATALKQLWHSLAARGVKKVLCFGQKRAECEEWAAATLAAGSPFDNQVFVHHASLDAKVRRVVEEKFARSTVALCFATATLELGIDIADIDLIVLVGPPDTTSAFLQRIGRGDRRKSAITTICFYRNEIEAALLRVFIDRAKNGLTDQQEYFFRSSVIAQQLCSYLKQTRYGEFEPQQAYQLFITPTGTPLIAREIYDQIIVELIDKEIFLLSERGFIKPGPGWQELYEEQAIYSNIADNRLIDLIDDATGRKLGQIQKGMRIGDTIIFAGQARRVVHRLPNRLIVQTEPNPEKTNIPVYSATRALTYDLARGLAEELQLANLFLPELKPDETHIFHCAGEAYGLILGELLAETQRLTINYLDWACLIVQGAYSSDYYFTRLQLEQCVNRHWRALEQFYDFGAFHKMLPNSARQDAVLRAFQIEKFQQIFSPEQK